MVATQEKRQKTACPRETYQLFCARSFGSGTVLTVQSYQKDDALKKELREKFHAACDSFGFDAVDAPYDPTAALFADNKTLSELYNVRPKGSGADAATHYPARPHSTGHTAPATHSTHAAYTQRTDCVHTGSTPRVHRCTLHAHRLHTASTLPPHCPHTTKAVSTGHILLQPGHLRLQARPPRRRTARASRTTKDWRAPLWWRTSKWSTHSRLASPTGKL